MIEKVRVWTDHSEQDVVLCGSHADDDVTSPRFGFSNSCITFDHLRMKATDSKNSSLKLILKLIG